MPDVSIRPLSAEDRTGWQPLWDGYLDHYREELDPAVTDAAFARLAGERDDMFGLVAETGAGLVGLAHVILHPSTWTMGRYAYLEDLFVASAARGTGTAQKLVEAASARATELGAERVYWRTQAFNGRARSLYDQVAQLSSDVIYER